MSHPAAPRGDWDDALSRLEETLNGYSERQALPDLATILRDAHVSEEFLVGDDRAVKVLSEAVLARPLSSLQAVEQRRTHVELLSMEVRLLTERLEDPSADPAEVSATVARLRDIRSALDELRRGL